MNGELQFKLIIIIQIFLLTLLFLAGYAVSKKVTHLIGEVKTVNSSNYDGEKDE